MSIRPLNIYDYSDLYLSLLEQLTLVDKSKINKEDFENYVNSQNEEWKTYIYEEKDCFGNSIPLASITILIERKIIHGMSKVGHIEDVVCDKKLRGKGIGKKMIDFATEYCMINGCYKVILDCSEYNIGFYEKCGYKQKGTEMAYYF